MDTQRLILFMVFTVSVFFLIDAWHREQQPPPATAAAGSSPAPATGPAATPVPTPTQPLAQPPATPPVQAPPPATGTLHKGETVRVETDLLVADIDTAGGDLRRLELLAHRDTLDKTKNFTLLQQQPAHVYIAQSGLIGNGLPNHRTQYSVEARDVKLATGADTVSVRLAAPVTDGVTKSNTRASSAAFAPSASIPASSLPDCR